MVLQTPNTNHWTREIYRRIKNYARVKRVYAGSYPNFFSENKSQNLDRRFDTDSRIQYFISYCSERSIGDSR